MAFTIARIAGKPAKFPLPAPVATEPKTLHLDIDADARLAAAAGGAARYLADAAGLETDATMRLQSSVVMACIESFDHLANAKQHLAVTLTRFPDRIEVALCFQGESPPALGRDTIADRPSPGGTGEGRRSVFAGVDRVQYESHKGQAVTLLTKYFGAQTSRF
jgi:hypothetical protein